MIECISFIITFLYFGLLIGFTIGFQNQIVIKEIGIILLAFAITAFLFPITMIPLYFIMILGRNNYMFFIFAIIAYIGGLFLASMGAVDISFLKYIHPTGSVAILFNIFEDIYRSKLYHEAVKIDSKEIWFCLINIITMAGLGYGFSILAIRKIGV